MNTKGITGLILAGGAGSRVNGQDKGTLQWRGQPLAGHVAARMTPQVERLLLSCNRNRDFYRQFTPHLLFDIREGYQGPLAGIEAAVPLVETDLLLISACDVPLLPGDLASRLKSALDENPEIAIAFADDGAHMHYLCALLRRACLKSLPGFLDKGGRAVRQWYQHCGAISVDFSDQPDSFKNINTLT